MEARGREHADKLRQLELTLEQARYEATRARRRYEAVDSDNRLVAGELERRWNERLVAVRELEGERDTLLATPEMTLSDIDRDRLLALDSELKRAWESPGATAATRNRIVASYSARGRNNEAVVKAPALSVSRLLVGRPRHRDRQPRRGGRTRRSAAGDPPIACDCNLAHAMADAHLASRDRHGVPRHTQSE
ncbi:MULTISPECIES: hypothetical protein [unclassified Bradyrhizobium]|uniref:Uncharacterized protein n=1 Tax=Bradyrhizobium yuanmingense TaxID=108015 RepID=A0ABV4GL53_9BRAD|nr:MULTISPECIES: hypothetical protein [unclassified Bradyrhizobium]